MPFYLFRSFVVLNPIECEMTIESPSEEEATAAHNGYVRNLVATWQNEAIPNLTLDRAEIESVEEVPAMIANAYPPLAIGPEEEDFEIDDSELLGDPFAESPKEEEEPE